jgi:hypothetical protein
VDADGWTEERDTKPGLAERGAPEMMPDEMRALAQRLRARGQSVLLRDQPEQQRDLKIAASLIEQFAASITGGA